jgi:hypothetical protein
MLFFGRLAKFFHGKLSFSHVDIQAVSNITLPRADHICIRCGYICNLRCKYCAEKVPYYTSIHKKCFDAQSVIEDLKKLSESFNFIKKINFTGGDCMLNRDFADLVRYVSTLKNVGSIYVVTNGGYIPHNDILYAIADSGKVRVEINIYPSVGNSPYVLAEKLKKMGIDYHLREGGVSWFDPSDNQFRGRTVEELKNLYASCAWSKLYIYESGRLNIRCGMACALLYFYDKYSECEMDYIDLRKLSPAEIAMAVGTLEARGYMDICNYCQGYSSTSKIITGGLDQL